MDLDFGLNLGSVSGPCLLSSCMVCGTVLVLTSSAPALPPASAPVLPSLRGRESARGAAWQRPSSDLNARTLKLSKISILLKIQKLVFSPLTFSRKSRKNFELEVSETNHPKQGTWPGIFHPNDWNMAGLKICFKWAWHLYKYFCDLLQEMDAWDEEKHRKRGLGKSVRHQEGAGGSKRNGRSRSVFPLQVLQSFLWKKN